MNGNYYQNPTFPSNATPINMDMSNNINDLPNNILAMNNNSKQDNLENILKINKGKRINAYISFNNSSEWQNKIISGIIENVGSNYLAMSVPSNNYWYLVKIENLDYIEFMEKIIF